MIIKKYNVSCLYLGSKFIEVDDPYIKLREKMTKKERLLYSKYADISEKPSYVGIDKNKIHSMFDFFYSNTQYLLLNDDNQMTKSELLGLLEKQFDEDTTASLIVFSGQSLAKGNWIINKEKTEEESPCFEEIHKLWVARKSQQNHLCFIVDSNYSGHWCRKAMLSRDPTVSVQAGCRYWEKTVDDKLNGSFFIHNLFKVVKLRRKEQIIEPYINTFQPTFFGSFGDVHDYFGLYLNFRCWQDMRRALMVTRNGYWPYGEEDRLHKEYKDFFMESVRSNSRSLSQDRKRSRSKSKTKETKRKSEKQKLKARDGFAMEFNEKGAVEFEGNWKNDKKHGEGIEYFENGFKKFEGSFENDIKEGQGKEFFGTGEVKYDGQFKDGDKLGQFTEFFQGGGVKFEGEFIKQAEETSFADMDEPDPWKRKNYPRFHRRCRRHHLHPKNQGLPHCLRRR